MYPGPTRTSPPLLQHLARRVHSSCVLLVGTYRDVDLDRRHPLSEMLSSLRAERLYERVLLRGFGKPEVVAMLEGTAQHRMDSRGVELAEVWQRETEGDPFIRDRPPPDRDARDLPRDGRSVSDVESIEDLGIEGVRR